MHWLLLRILFFILTWYAIDNIVINIEFTTLLLVYLFFQISDGFLIFVIHDLTNETKSDENE
jgi:hypothetical protein